MAEAILAAARSVLEENGFEVGACRELSHAAASRNGPAALLGFAGPQVAGTVSLFLDWAALQRSHPKPGAEPPELLDWLRELSNLLVGKVKVTLSRRGVPINIGLPTSIVGEALGFDTSSATLKSHAFDLGGSEGVVIFDAILDPAIAWLDLVENAPTEAEDADALFF